MYRSNVLLSYSKVLLVSKRAYKYRWINVPYLIVCICCSVAIGYRGNNCDHTQVANGTGEKIQVEIKHDGGTTKRFLEKDEVRCEKTSITWVHIKVLDDQGEMRILQSDYSDQENTGWTF